MIVFVFLVKKNFHMNETLIFFSMYCSHIFYFVKELRIIFKAYFYEIRSSQYRFHESCPSRNM